MTTPTEALRALADAQSWAWCGNCDRPLTAADGTCDAPFCCCDWSAPIRAALAAPQPRTLPMLPVDDEADARIEAFMATQTKPTQSRPLPLPVAWEPDGDTQAPGFKALTMMRLAVLLDVWPNRAGQWVWTLTRSAITLHHGECATEAEAKSAAESAARGKP